MANELQLKLKEGDLAPSFTAATNGGGRISLSDYKGKNVILYFYPRDNTPGCTKEACAFRDHWDEFKNKGAVLLGVSTDKAKSHDKFVEKHKLPFPLLADEDKISGRRFIGRCRQSLRSLTWRRRATPANSPEHRARFDCVCCWRHRIGWR